MKFILLSLTLTGLILFYPYAAISMDNISDDKSPVAKVEDRVIYNDEFQKILVQYRNSGDTRKLLESLTKDGRTKIINQLIENKLLVIEASNRDLDKLSEVQTAIQEAVDNVLAEYLIKIEIRNLDLSDKYLSKFYNENRDMFISKARIKARHIVTHTQQEADVALERVRAGEDFQKVAADLNIDSTKSKSGNLGLVPRGIMVEPFENALFSLSEGEISDVVKTSFGYHIILAERIERGQLQPFDTVKEKIKQHIINTHIEHFKKNLREKYNIWINRELLEQTDK